MDNANKIESIEEMLVESKSEVLLKKSFAIFKIHKGNRISKLIIIIMSVLLAYMISNANTIPILQEILDMLLNVILAVFGIIFTGYAFFQALLNGKHISALIEDVSVDAKTNKSKNTLHKTNWNFIQLMMQFIVAIFVTLIIKVILCCMPDSYVLFPNILLNLALSTVLISLYFYEIIVCLWRMVSFIFNIYQLFNSYAVTKYIAFLNGEHDE